MRIDGLILTDFRSYATADLVFPPGPQVLVGPNAVGKTNLLEALAVVSSGRSHRTRADAELVRWGASFARLEAVVAHPVSGEALADRVEVTIPLPASAPAGRPPRQDVEAEAAGTAAAVGAPAESLVLTTTARRRILVNGAPRRVDALARITRTVTFAPEAMLLVAGSPSLRRDEIDSVAAQLHPVHRRGLATYGRALLQRNSLLRLIRDGRADRAELQYWDATVIEEGGAIVERRLATLDALAAPVASAHAEIAPGEATLRLSYLSSSPGQAGERPRDALRRRLSETADKELWNGMTLVGPHRDDIVFELGGRPLAAFGSRGQQRSAILALKLGELEALSREDGEAPLLLLDDVFSELDPDRRAHLVRRIGSLPQAFITTTALADLDPALVAAATAWVVTPGHASPATHGAR